MSGLTEFIPIPVVGTVVGMAVDAAVSKAKSFVSGNNLNNSHTLKKEVKHGIKELDIEGLDRARAKVTASIKDLNKQLGKSDYNFHPCKHIYKCTYSYHYLDRRIAKLEAQAHVMKEMAEKTIQCCEKVREPMANKKLKLDAHLKNVMKLQYHDGCDRSYCIKK